MSGIEEYRFVMGWMRARLMFVVFTHDGIMFVQGNELAKTD